MRWGTDAAEHLAAREVLCVWRADDVTRCMAHLYASTSNISTLMGYSELGIMRIVCNRIFFNNFWPCSMHGTRSYLTFPIHVITFVRCDFYQIWASDLSLQCITTKSSTNTCWHTHILSCSLCCNFTHITCQGTMFLQIRMKKSLFTCSDWDPLCNKSAS